MTGKDSLEKALSALEGMQRAQPAERVRTELLQRLQQHGEAKIIPLSRPQLQWIAAGFALLLTANVLLLQSYRSRSDGSDVYSTSDTLIENFNDYLE